MNEGFLALTHLELTDLIQGELQAEWVLKFRALSSILKRGIVAGWEAPLRLHLHGVL